MSIKTKIYDNLKNIDEDELQKFYDRAFNKHQECSDEFSHGFDSAIAYLSGAYDTEDVQDFLD